MRARGEGPALLLRASGRGRTDHDQPPETKCETTGEAGASRLTMAGTDARPFSMLIGAKTEPDPRAAARAASGRYAEQITISQGSACETTGEAGANYLASRIDRDFLDSKPHKQNPGPHVRAVSVQVRYAMLTRW